MRVVLININEFKSDSCNFVDGQNKWRPSLIVDCPTFMPVFEQNDKLICSNDKDGDDDWLEGFRKFNSFLIWTKDWEMPAEKLEQTINKKVNTFHPKTSFRSNIYKVSGPTVSTCLRWLWLIKTITMITIMTTHSYFNDHPGTFLFLLETPLSWSGSHLWRDGRLPDL